MPGLPRCICSECGNDVAARKDGTPREHYVRRERMRMGTPVGDFVIANATSGKACKGSGEPAAK